MYQIVNIISIQSQTALTSGKKIIFENDKNKRSFAGHCSLNILHCGIAQNQESVAGRGYGRVGGEELADGPRGAVLEERRGEAAEDHNPQRHHTGGRRRMGG